MGSLIAFEQKFIFASITSMSFGGQGISVYPPAELLSRLSPDEDDRGCP